MVLTVQVHVREYLSQRLEKIQRLAGIRTYHIRLQAELPVDVTPPS